jgi:hypothetical protein
MSIGIVTHVFNEELLLPCWLEHHSKIAEQGIIIDHHSNDLTLNIVEEFIKKNPTWKVVQSRLPQFSAIGNDAEVMDYEQQLTSKWKMTLNATEFIFTPNLKDKLAEWESLNPEMVAFGARAFCMVDKEVAAPLQNPIWTNRTHGMLDHDRGVNLRRWRYMHKSLHGQYSIGRHETSLPHLTKMDFTILHMFFSPWDQCKQRKLQIQTRIPESDKAQRLGFQHIVTEAQLEQIRLDLLPQTYNLLENPLFKEAYDFFNT